MDFTRSTCAALRDSVQYFVNSFRDLRIMKKKLKKMRVYVGDSETVTKHCLITYNV
jgi:hypothetical protein